MKDLKIYQEEALRLLNEIVAVPARSREEKNRCDFLENYLTQRNQEVHRVGNNLWCEAQEHRKDAPTVLLNSHIDTVPATEQWTHNPFELKAEPFVRPDDTEELRYYGLGSNDAGASLVCLTEAFLYLSEHSLPYNLILGLSCEEEVTGKGGIDLLLPQLPPVDFAIVGEPTSMKAAVAEKGLMVVDCCAHGIAGHAAHNTGDNAIYRAMEAIEWFRTTVIDDDPQSPVNSGVPAQSLLGPVKMTVTIIEGGTKHNVVPDACRFTVDVRVNDRYSNESLFGYIQQHLSHFGCTAEARSFRLSSSGILPDHPAVRRCKDLGIECFGSPTLSDQSRMHFASMKMGPGDTHRSHTADEYILKDELFSGLSGYIEFLEGLVL